VVSGEVMRSFACEVVRVVGMVRGGTVCDWAEADYMNEGVRSLFKRVLSACV